MHDRPPPKSEHDVLPEPVAARLLARASELDAARSAGSSIADLRAAAAEASISAPAFDAALAELESDARAPVTAVEKQPPRRRSRMWGVTAAVSALLAAGAVAVFFERAPAGEAAAGPPMVEEPILLRCLAPGEAAELIRPLLPLRSNTMRFSPSHAPRVLTIRATPAQLETVRSTLDRHEGAGAPACAAPPPAATTP